MLDSFARLLPTRLTRSAIWVAVIVRSQGYRKNSTHHWLPCEIFDCQSAVAVWPCPLLLSKEYSHRKLLSITVMLQLCYKHYKSMNKLLTALSIIWIARACAFSIYRKRNIRPWQSVTITSGQTVFSLLYDIVSNTI